MNRRGLPLLLALALLAGCGASLEPLPPPAIEEAVSLPETAPAGTLSAPALVTEGREPAENYPLPAILFDCSTPDRMDTSTPLLLAELPEADAAFYSLEDEKVLIRWEDCTVEFDWLSLTPRQIPPWLDCFDIDGDQENELLVACYIGSGTGVSIEELHILEKGPEKTMTAYTFPEILWQEKVPKLFHAAEISGRTFAVLGRELVEFDGGGLDLETASSGLIAEFCKECKNGWNGLQFRGRFCLSQPDRAYPCYVAETSAQILYENGMFTLQDFHLYSYDQ